MTFNAPLFLEAASAVTEQSVESLVGRSRHQPLAFLRQAAMAAAYEAMHPKSLCQVARVFGDRTHGAVLWARDRVKDHAEQARVRDAIVQAYRDRDPGALRSEDDRPYVVRRGAGPGGRWRHDLSSCCASQVEYFDAGAHRYRVQTGDEPSLPEVPFCARCKERLIQREPETPTP